MKKLIIPFLCFALCLSFSACGGSKPAPSDTAQTPVSAPVDAVQTAEPSPNLSAANENEAYENRVNTHRTFIADKDDFKQHPHQLQQGTSLTVALTYINGALTPWVAQDFLLNNVYEGLLYAHMNSADDIRGALAESWYCSEDGLNWYFKIRDNVKYSDGTACNAEAICGYFDFCHSENLVKFGRYGISSWSSLSGNELQITLEQPVSDFEFTLCEELCIGSAAAFMQFGYESYKATVATGPYIISDYDLESGAVLIANPHYYLPEKQPSIETINIIFTWGYTDTEASLLQESTADIVHFFDVTTLAANVQTQYEVFLYPTIPYTIYLNSNVVPEFSIKEVRMAMCRFVDFEVINDEVFGGMGTVQNSIWAEGASCYVKTDNFYCDTDEGLSLLADAGLSPADIEFEFHYALNSTDIFYALEKQLNEVGVNATYAPRDGTREPYRLSEQPILISTFFDALSPIKTFNESFGHNSLSFHPFSVDQVKFYGEELYEKIYTEYETLKTLSDWDEQLASLRKITSYIQDEYICIGGIAPPRYLLIKPEFKNPVLFDGAIQLYYIYK